LVELMVVVTIIAILAAISTVAYSRYVGRARLTEAANVLAEMISKEQTYALEFARFMPLRAGATLPTPDTNGGYTTTETFVQFWPVKPDQASGFDSRRVATSIADTSAYPATWRTVGMRPKAKSLFCTYLANANTPNPVGTSSCPTGSEPGCLRDIAGAYGQRMFPCASGGVNCSTSRFFYAIAACNLSGPASSSNVTTGVPTTDESTILGVSSASAQLAQWNDGR